MYHQGSGCRTLRTVQTPQTPQTPPTLCEHCKHRKHRKHRKQMQCKHRKHSKLCKHRKQRANQANTPDTLNCENICMIEFIQDIMQRTTLTSIQLQNHDCTAMVHRFSTPSYGPIPLASSQICTPSIIRHNIPLSAKIIFLHLVISSPYSSIQTNADQQIDHTG